MNEFELIRRLTHSLPTNASVVVGSGDDCAVLEVGWPDRFLLFKTDAVVQGVHFTPATAPEKIGHKAVELGAVRGEDGADGWERPLGTSVLTGPNRELWQLIEERDLVNGVPPDINIEDGFINVIKNLSYGSDVTSIARVMVALPAAFRAATTAGGTPRSRAACSSSGLGFSHRK